MVKKRYKRLKDVIKGFNYDSLSLLKTYNLLCVVSDTFFKILFIIEPSCWVYDFLIF